MPHVFRHEVRKLLVMFCKSGLLVSAVFPNNRDWFPITVNKAFDIVLNIGGKLFPFAHVVVRSGTQTGLDVSASGHGNNFDPFSTDVRPKSELHWPVRGNVFAL